VGLMIGDPPPLYLSILDQMDPTSTGTVSLSAAHRVLSTSKLPAATIEKVRPAYVKRELISISDNQLDSTR